MDALVEAALRKWPKVPHCYGWLALDARGQWYMRDERAQAAGPFPQVKGSPVRHDKLRDFIHRNYGRDERGAAYFQNGPQRVYVDLELTPWVWRVLDAQGRLQAHTGELASQVLACGCDEAGRLYLQARLPSVGEALGVVHSLDMDLAADALSAGAWGELQSWPEEALIQRFKLVRRPRPLADTGWQA